MSDIYRRLRPLLVVALLVGSAGAAPVLLTGGVGATVNGVTVDDSTVTAGTELSGYVSFSTMESNTVYLVLSSDGTYDDGTDKLLTFDAKEPPQSWSGLKTDDLADGDYTLYAWDASSGSLSDGESLTDKDASKTVTIDSTDPTSTIDPSPTGTGRSGTGRSERETNRTGLTGD